MNPCPPGRLNGGSCLNKKLNRKRASDFHSLSSIKLKVMNGYNDNHNGTPKGARLVFGIFMVLVYLAVGLLFIFNVFSIDNTAISATVGGILCAYGVWRAYRLYRGGN